MAAGPHTLIAFTFSFSITGLFAAWEVWSNGKERAGHQNDGLFSGVIAPGAVLQVAFKIWDGTYNITYTCKSGNQLTSDPAKPAPISGTARGAEPAVEIIHLQF